MKILLILTFFVASIAFTAGVSAQSAASNTKTFVPSKTLRASGALAEVLLRRVDLESQYEEMLVSYTEEYPGVKDIKFEIDALNKELDRLNLVKPEDAAKLTPSLGMLIVKKAEIEGDYLSVLKRFNEMHPDVKRAKRRLEIFERAIRTIL